MLSVFRQPWQAQMESALLTFGIDPFCIACSAFASCFVLTTQEKLEDIFYTNLFYYMLQACVYALAVIALFPVFVVSLPIWRCLQNYRIRPYRFLTRKAEDVKLKTKYMFASANLCLLTECFARINNLRDGKHRAKGMSARIVASQSQAASFPDNFESGNRILHDIHANFPPGIDFFCCQETFHGRFTAVFLKNMHKVYPHIVYDAAIFKKVMRRMFQNSGLMIASRYPVLDADFNMFTEAVGAPRSCKGFLQIKVLLGQEENGTKNVGYIGNTHMQAYQGTNTLVHESQLSEVSRWSDAFRRRSKGEGERVLFDVISGDWNLDNLSPVDKHVWDHELFRKYKDPCMEKPGRDFDWTVGTEMRQSPMLEEAVSTPQGLKSVLENPSLRRRYIVDGSLEQNDPSILNIPESGSNGLPDIQVHGGRRRIDRIIHRRSDTGVVPLHCGFVTQLATLTDHIPVTLVIRTDT